MIRFYFQDSQPCWLFTGGQMPERFLISIVDDEPVRLALEGLVRLAGYVARVLASAEGFPASSALPTTLASSRT